MTNDYASIKGSFDQLANQLTTLDSALNKLSDLVAHQGEDELSPQPKAKSNPTIKLDGAGFLWKPVSDSTGKLAILLPPGLTSKVVGVSVLSPEGRVIESGKFGGVGNGEREHYRFSKPGNAFPVGAQVLAKLKNGSTQKITIINPAVRFEKR